MSPRHEVDARAKLGVLRFLAVDNATLQATADEMALPYQTVFDIASDYGYPEVDRMLWAIDHLQTVDDGHMDTPTPKEPAPRPDLSLARVPAAPRTATTSVNEPLHQASESDHARTRNLGTKISTLLADLTARLHDETAEREAKTAAAAQKAKNAKRIAELEAELARLKGKPAPATRTVSAAGPTSRPPSVPTGEYPCTRCDRVLDTPQGRSAHERRAHDGWSPSATAKSA